MTGATAQPVFYASAPRISVGGDGHDYLTPDRVVSMLTEETTLGLFRAEVRVVNWGPRDGGVGFLLLDRRVVDFGKELKLELGPPSAAGEGAGDGAGLAVFEGRIMALEAHYPAQRPPELTVLAEDRFQDLRMKRRTRSFEDISDADVIRRIASDHGLTGEVDVDGTTHPLLAQINQSDLAFLRERADAVDADLWMEGSTLHAQGRSRRRTGVVDLEYGRELIAASVIADLAHQRSSVSVGGWDVDAKRGVDERADDSAVTGELDGGDSGASVLSIAFGERPDRVVSSGASASGEATELAKAHFRARARRFVRARGVAEGNPAIRVGTRLNFTGLGAIFSKPFKVTLVRHTFDRSDGYRTQFEAESPAIGS